MMKKITALLLVLLLLAGCSAAGDVETLLRAPQLSGESAALQKALNTPVVGKVVSVLVDHQDEIIAKLNELGQAAANGQVDPQQLAKYQDQLQRIGKVLDLFSRFF